MTGNERRYVDEALRSTWISAGPFVERMETDFARFTGAHHAVAVANGTAALHLAYLALGVGPGDEVVMPALTFAACAAMVVACGATPRFVDSDAETLGMSADATKRAIGTKTKAIVPTHLFGSVCDLGPLVGLARSGRISVIEDAAEAIGARYDGRHVGTFGDVGCFSFHAAKTVAMGEGGMVITDDDDVAERIRLLRNHGYRSGTHYWHDIVGFNYKLTNMQAAIGCAQLERIDSILRRRKEIDDRYQERLMTIRGVRIPVTPRRGTRALWIQTILLDPNVFGQGRDGVRSSLMDAGIETRPLFSPIYRMPPYTQYATGCPVAERASEWGLMLPVFEEMTDSQIEYVCDSLSALARG